MEEEKKFFVTDANGEKHEIDKSSFELVQNDKKIYDVKFDTKPTTFLKDSLKRFRKNKASVAGFYIIGFIVLLAIFVPICSQSDISISHPSESYLTPKLFNAGTGWWDGCESYKDVVYDVNTECPDPKLYDIRGVRDLETKPVEYINQPHEYGKNGEFQIYSPKLDKDSPAAEVTEIYLSSYAIPKIDVNEVLNMKYNLFEEETDYADAAYKITANFTVKSEATQLVLVDYNKDYGEKEIDIAQKINEYTDSIEYYDDYIYNFSIRFLFENSFDEGREILIREILFESTDETVVDVTNGYTVQDYFNAASFKSGNEAIRRTKYFDDDTSRPNIAYWSSTGFRGVLNVEIQKCSFIYDRYEVVYGNTPNFNLGLDQLRNYVVLGYCEYNILEGPESFKVLSEKCPIVSVDEQYLDDTGMYVFNCTVTMYKVLGYDSAPRWLMGTDLHGKDFFHLLFHGVGISLLLGTVVGAVCFTFGLIWGSISGYFGGAVDLVMERFCDILGGLPWIVLMTLIILLCGNNFFTFAVALCLTGWMGTAARARTQFYRFKNREYVLASRTLGASDMRLIFKHVLPNSLGTIITGAVLIIPSTIFSESTIAYLGLGLTGDGSLGTILAGNQSELAVHPYLLFIPSVVIALLMISFNLFGNGLRDAVNPSLKGSD